MTRKDLNSKIMNKEKKSRGSRQVEEKKTDIKKEMAEERGLRD